MSSGPVIILTGASRGLGLATLRILLEKHNARVAAISRSSPPDLLSIKDRFPDRVELLHGDVGSIDSNKQAVDRTVQQWGSIDGLIINAGSLEPVGRIADLPLDQISSYTDANLHAALYLIQPALPYLRRSQQGGRIVLVSSGASQSAYPGWGLYCIAKSGFNAVARVLAAEERENGVGIWSIRPGVINMQRTLRDVKPGIMTPEHVEKFKSLHESGKLLEPEAPGAVLAGLAVQGPLELSGEFIDWTDGRLRHLTA